MCVTWPCQPDRTHHGTRDRGDVAPDSPAPIAGPQHTASLSAHHNTMKKPIAVRREIHDRRRPHPLHPAWPDRATRRPWRAYPLALPLLQPALAPGPAPTAWLSDPPLQRGRAARCARGACDPGRSTAGHLSALLLRRGRRVVHRPVRRRRRLWPVLGRRAAARHASPGRRLLCGLG